MKLKIEIQAEPDEIQDLFVPSNKQAEFAKVFVAAYYKFVKDVAATTAQSLNPVARRRKRKTDV